MKKLYVLLIGLFQFCLIHAQSQSLQLIYITTDHTTSVGSLLDNIKDIYRTAVSDRSQAVIFYLANTDSPRIVKVNLPGDNRDDIGNIYEAIITNSETIVFPDHDLKRIVSIFDELELVGPGGEPRFMSAEILYYITPTFWDLKYNEMIIASAYFTLDMDSEWAKDYFTMSIYHNASDGLEIDEKSPFGLRNLCKDYKFFLLTY